MHIQLQKLRKKLTLKDNKTTIKPGTQIAIMLPDAHNEKRAAETGEGGGACANDQQVLLNSIVVIGKTS